MKNYKLTILGLIGMFCLGAATVNSIKFFTDYPNSIPVGSDFFILQRNNGFINSSDSQIKQDWFNNPVFTGNGGIQGVWTAVTFVGDGSQLTGISSPTVIFTTSNLLYFAVLNIATNNDQLFGGNATNNDELFGVNSTNYTGLTSNALYLQITASSGSSNVWLQSTKVYLKTNTLDVILGDVSQTPTHDLHIFHTNSANNDVVGIDSTSSDSSSMLHIKNRSAQGPFFDYEAANVRWGFGISSLNDFVMRTGPNAADPVNGSTVTTIATNGGWTVNALTNNAATASTFAFWNSDKGLVSTTDGSTLTGLTINYSTNAIPSSGALTFGRCYDTNLQADITLPAFTLDPTKYETLVLDATNSTAAVHTFTMPAGVRVAIANGGGNKIYCTNALITEIVVAHDGLKWTNAWKNDF